MVEDKTTFCNGVFKECRNTRNIRKLQHKKHEETYTVVRFIHSK